MAKFTQFNPSGQQPVQTFDGDRIVHMDEYVYVFKRGPAASAVNPDERASAIIKLTDGQCVKEIPDGDARR